MARIVDYDKKIEVLKEKIATKTEQLLELKKDLKWCEEQAAKSKMQDVAMFLQEKGVDPEEALKALQEHFQ